MKKYIIPIVIICVSICISILFFPYLPDSMASHWGINGNVDGYSSRLFNVIFFPIIQIFLFLLLYIVPRIDPKRKNILKFEGKFHLFVYSILIFMLLLQIYAYLWNTGVEIPVEIVMPLLMGGLFLVIGEMVKDAKQNYTIGIRTPWTLSSEVVWDKTHRLGGRLFKICGILSILSIFFSSYAFITVIGTVILTTIYLFIYSYLEFKKEIGV